MLGQFSKKLTKLTLRISSLQLTFSYFNKTIRDARRSAAVIIFLRKTFQNK